MKPGDRLYTEAEMRALREQFELVDRALLYRSCGRFDREACRDRPEIEEGKWCAWCKLAHERGIENTNDPNPATKPEGT